MNIRLGLLPKGDNELTGVARHMVDLVRRDVDVVTSVKSEKKKKRIKLILKKPGAGRPVNIVDVKNEFELEKVWDDDEVDFANITKDIEIINHYNALDIKKRTNKLTVVSGKIEKIDLGDGKERTLNISSDRGSMSSVVKNDLVKIDSSGQKIKIEGVPVKTKVLSAEEKKRRAYYQVEGVYRHKIDAYNDNGRLNEYTNKELLSMLFPDKEAKDELRNNSEVEKLVAKRRYTQKIGMKYAPDKLDGSWFVGGKKDGSLSVMANNVWTELNDRFKADNNRSAGSVYTKKCDHDPGKTCFIANSETR